jgi:hypothetical protein
VRQSQSLSMGWCVNCHRTGVRLADNSTLHASMDCSTCHY